MSIDNVTLKIRNYKCFGNDEYGYDCILPINLIIGRNNSGKSTLLDLIDYATVPKDISQLGHHGQPPKILLSSLLTEKELARVFEANVSGGPIPYKHWDYGKHWIGKKIDWELTPSGFEFVAVDPPFDYDGLEGQKRNLAKVKGNPFSEFEFKRLLADRDITPEPDTGELAIQSNGRGVTNAIGNYLNKAALPSSLIEDTLLNELNSIFEPDGHISRILVQQLGIGHWELYFEEREKGRVPLSHTGSGLKTILLVLVFLHLIPHIEKKPLSKYLFGFEELENNLHPALQRRLLLYLRKVAVEKGSRFFLTTHSSVAIDLFANDEKAQILHVTHDMTCASVKRVTTYVENRGILDDLDIRASDLLQANGIVWLEGPSDRLYFNHWIDLWSNGQLKEGAHYQCVFYGGRLLAHLSASDPDVDAEEVVKILRVNRNAILLVDSDKKNSGDTINSTKQRILDEIRNFGGMAWLTAGKEIENYIPTQALASLYETTFKNPLKQYQEFSNYLENIETNAGKKFLRNKVLFAEQIITHIAKDDLKVILDLEYRITEACRVIRNWNRMTAN